MTKNLNIRLEDETFDNFTQYCEINRYSKTEILKDYIQRLIQGELQPFRNDGNDSVMINPTQGLDQAIANHPKLKALEDKLEGLIELVESKFSNDDVTQGNDTVTSNEAVMTHNGVMISNDKSLQNNSSEDSLEGGLNENQVLEAVEETETLETPLSEDKLDPPLEDIPESPDIQGIEDNGSENRIETAIAGKTDQGLTDKELADLLAKQGRKTTPSTVNRWRRGKNNPTGKNKNLFEEWEVRGDRWFSKN